MEAVIIGASTIINLLQNIAYSMSLNDSTMVTTGGPLEPEFHTYHATEEEISASALHMCHAVSNSLIQSGMNNCMNISMHCSFLL